MSRKKIYENFINFISQKTEKFMVELSAIALRDLKSTGFTNSKKPYLVVDLNSLDVKSNGSLGLIKSVNNGYGNNPTINQTFKVELDLPVLTNNIPPLNCFVEDFFLKIFKEKLGSFEISIRDSVIETKKEFSEMQEKLDNFIKKSKSHKINIFF